MKMQVCELRLRCCECDALLRYTRANTRELAFTSQPASLRDINLLVMECRRRRDDGRKRVGGVARESRETIAV